jgi:hypothetical protein
MRTGDCKVGCAGVPIGVAGCSERVTVEPVRPHANRNIVPQYPIQQAAWITHPSWDTLKDQFLTFSRWILSCRKRAHSRCMSVPISGSSYIATSAMSAWGRIAAISSTGVSTATG